MIRLLATIRRAARDYDAAQGEGSARDHSIKFAMIAVWLALAAINFAAITGRL